MKNLTRMEIVQKVRQVTPYDIVMSICVRKDRKFTRDLFPFDPTSRRINWGLQGTNLIFEKLGLTSDDRNKLLNLKQSDYSKPEPYFLQQFEMAIETLRGGNISFCNYQLQKIGLPTIKDHGKELPYLRDDYTDEQIDAYIELANYQKGDTMDLTSNDVTERLKTSASDAENDIEFTQDGITIIFYKKENDAKFSFKIKGDEELTSKIISSVKKERIKEAGIHYAKRAIFKIIRDETFS